MMTRTDAKKVALTTLVVMATVTGVLVAMGLLWVLIALTFNA
jgi:hypothetical protein